MEIYFSSYDRMLVVHNELAFCKLFFFVSFCFNIVRKEKTHVYRSPVNWPW